MLSKVKPVELVMPFTVEGFPPVTATVRVLVALAAVQ